MDAAVHFNQLLRDWISPVLKKNGFLKKGQTFYCNVEKNFGLINVQKSVKSSKERIFFTVNIGVFSCRLAQFSLISYLSGPPSIEECHWNERLGFLLPEQEDKWWPIGSEIPLEQIGQELVGYLLNLAIPEIKKYIHDEALRDLWLTGQSPGLTDVQRLMNLSVLLKILGPSDLLDCTREKLKQISEGKPIALTVARHLERLEGRIARSVPGSKGTRNS